jgi:Histidine kinase
MKWNKVFIIVAGSLLYLSIPVLISPDLGTGRNIFRVPGFQRQFLFFVATLVFFFFNYFFLLPRYFNQKKKWIYIGIITAMIPIYCSSLIFSSTPPMPQGDMRPAPPHEKGLSQAPFEAPEPPQHNRPFVFSENAVLFFLMLTFSISIYIYNRWQEELTAKLIHENKYLRAQIEPHFFFNSLNSIFSLVVTKNDQAPEAIVKMGNLMRYVMTESAHDHVDLDKEINYIQTYIEFQKTRFSGIDHIQFDLDIPPNNYQIVPLILIPFVENVFKHGINGEDTAIEITLILIGSELTLTTKNKKFNQNTDSTGIGIQNAEKRLSISYPANHTLRIFEADDSYFVTLSIVLSHDQSHRH